MTATNPPPTHPAICPWLLSRVALHAPVAQMTVLTSPTRYLNGKKKKQREQREQKEHKEKSRDCPSSALKPREIRGAATDRDCTRPITMKNFSTSLLLVVLLGQHATLGNALLDETTENTCIAAGGKWLRFWLVDSGDNGMTLDFTNTDLSLIHI